MMFLTFKHFSERI